MPDITGALRNRHVTAVLRSNLQSPGATTVKAQHCSHFVLAIRRPFCYPALVPDHCL